MCIQGYSNLLGTVYYVQRLLRVRFLANTQDSHDPSDLGLSCLVKKRTIRFWNSEFNPQFSKTIARNLTCSCQNTAVPRLRVCSPTLQHCGRLLDPVPNHSWVLRITSDPLSRLIISSFRHNRTILGLVLTIRCRQ